jgi:hypothetical protein
MLLLVDCKVNVYHLYSAKLDAILCSSMAIAKTTFSGNALELFPSKVYREFSGTVLMDLQ